MYDCDQCIFGLCAGAVKQCINCPDKRIECTGDIYQEEAMRTAAGMYGDLLQNGVMGLCGEAGECIDIVKKHLFQGHELDISIHSLRMEGDSKTAQESVFHFAYPCTILQKRMQKTTFCTRKNGFFRKKGEKFGAKPSASFCAPMIRTDTFPLNFSHRISGSSMSMVSFAPICSTFD